MKPGLIYKNLRKELKHPSSSTGETKGQILLSPNCLALIKDGLRYQLVSSDIVVGDTTINVDELSANDQPITINLLERISPDLSNYYVAENATPFYKQFSRLFSIPNELMIYELACKEDYSMEKLESHLKYAISVRECLESIKDYKTELVDCEEFFIHANEPLIIKSYYNFSGEVQQEKADEVLAFIQNDKQKEIYRSFFKIQVISFLKSVAEKERFQSLFENFNTIYLNFKNSIELYFRDYDYEKNRNELQAKKIDLAKKIHSVINDISAKVITIPAAYLLILKDISIETPFKYLNIIYFFASIIYALIIQTSFSNQWYLLSTFKNDRNEFLSTSLKSPELVALFGRYKTELDNSVNLQNRILIFLTVVLWLLPFSIAAIVAYYSL